MCVKSNLHGNERKRHNLAFLLGTEKISYEVASKTVLKDVSLGVDSGDRIGIVGRNGDGKSTLLRLLDKQISPDEGRVIWTHGITVSFLGQRDSLDDSESVLRSVVGDVAEFEWASDVRTREVMEGLLRDIDPEARVGTLSGGQRRRVDLARVLIEQSDVLMLDEPTNHLDIKAITWLANHLKIRWKRKEGALLVVTHDRWFLDEVANAMWEVHDSRVEAFEGGFSAYILQRVERERLATLAEQKRQNMLRRELAWLSRGARARATKPKFHVEAARALIDDVPELRNAINLRRMAMSRIGKQVVDIENVSVYFGDPGADAAGRQKPVLDDITWMIGPGDRFGIVGANGAGKTTLLRLIEGAQKPTSGTVKIGSTVRFAVLSQHLDSLSQFSGERVRDVVGRYSRRVMFDGKEMTPSQLLEDLGFDSADLNEPVDDLSGGERRRLALMMILLDEPNVLILDEPGNDLDIDMLAAVENLLDGWPGTLFLVTHDRYLMEHVTDNQFALIDGKLRHLPGGIDEYLKIVDDIDAESLRNAETSASGLKAQDGVFQADAPNAKTLPNPQRLTNKESYALRKEVASLESKMKTMHNRITKAQSDMGSIDPTDHVALMEAQQNIEDLKTKLNDLENRWLESSEKLEDD